jgi:hypothetical protein
MRYEYVIFKPESTEDTAATFSTIEPLPHIQVGNSLMLESDTFSTVAGYHQTIVHVESYLRVSEQALGRLCTYVYVSQRDRAEILQR